MPPTSPSKTRRRKFCALRQPYNTHVNMDLSAILLSIDNGSKYRVVAKDSNIRLGTLFRMHKKWVEAGRPSSFKLMEERGRNPVLTKSQELELCSRIDHHISDERVLQCKDISMFARSVYENQIDHLLRS